MSLIGKSSNSDESSFGIQKDYSTDEATTSVFQENIEAIDPQQIFQVECDDEMKELSKNSDGGWKYVATLKALVESCSEEEEDGEKTEITEVKQCGPTIHMRRFYGKKVAEKTSASRDVFRMRLLKTFLARERAQKAKSRLSNQSDSMHSDTSVENVSDVSIVSNTTYSDDGEIEEKEKKDNLLSVLTKNTRSDEHDIKDEKTGKSDAILVKTTTDDSETASTVPSVGSMWSEGPSATESQKSSTETIGTPTSVTSNGYSTQEPVEKKHQKKKLNKIKRKERNKKKLAVKRKIMRRKLGVVSGVEADGSDGESDGESCQ